MARPLRTVPRAGALSPAAAIAVLLAVLAVLFSPAAHGSTYLTEGVAPASGAVRADSGPYADDGHSAVRNALIRSPRDTPAERSAPPVTATLASDRGAGIPLSPARSDEPAVSPVASVDPANRHQGQAPPPHPGT
ncbi:hypothetical protein ACFY78_17190 [Streptomyces olindensis]|uniref:hypothetical protein n=1 Tax=Streptomyces olindensis TaxID=358823 RepID=UPI0036AE5BFC